MVRVRLFQPRRSRLAGGVPPPVHPPVPRRARAFAALTIAISAAAFAVALTHASRPAGQHVLDAALLAFLTALAYRYPVEFGPTTRLYITSAATFAGALLLPPWLAMASAAVGVLAGECLTPGGALRRAFNTCALSLNVLAAAAIVATVGSGDLLHHIGMRGLVAIVLAVPVHYAVNAALVEAMGGLQRRRNPFTGMAARHGRMLSHRAALYVLGLFTALVGHEQPLALLLGTVPGWAIYRSLRDGVLLRSQTREAVEELADIVDMRDRYTFEHSKRVAELSRALARRLRLSAEVSDIIYRAARVHDVGKIGIRSSTLFKPGSMDDEEWAEMRTHPELGARLISHFPDFNEGRAIILHHHERWDGNGYPGSLAGTAIPLGARLVAITDTFDAMTSHRAYRRALPAGQVVGELTRGRGAQFDPELLDEFLALLREHPEFLQRTDSAQLGGPPHVIAAG